MSISIGYFISLVEPRIKAGKITDVNVISTIEMVTRKTIQDTIPVFLCFIWFSFWVNLKTIPRAVER
jgi:hypothetical protein